ncbi:MAG TPA: SGNH/GDSL hydrolase family protein [Bradyrhizobium sp.]
MRKLSTLAGRAIANTLLVCASLLVGYVAIEYAVFRIMLPVMPLDIHASLPAVADVLMQTSKSNYLPQDYIALLGDSYAEGYGDWLLQVGSKRRGPFHSADIIHQQTGRDVVSFGIGGAGSAEAMVLRPAAVFPSSSCSVYPAIDPPRQMFVYFYEGNDIEDNLDLIGKVNERYGSTDSQAIDRYLNEQYAGWPSLNCHAQFGQMLFKQAEFMSQYYITGYHVTYCGAPFPSRNHIVVADQTIETPALQGASPHLSDENIRLGMDVFARSLAWLRQHLPQVPITMVYVPSPLTIYHHAGDTISFCSPYTGGLVAKAISERHHDLIRDMVASISAAERVDFVDATPALRDAAETRVIHGPRDWDHLNKTGYEVLGKLVATELQRSLEVERQRPSTHYITTGASGSSL